jgi:hypothetical protein
MPETQPLKLDGPPVHVAVEPGTEIVLRGSYHSTYDGSVIDAATTTWPKEAPGGASVDPGGLVDFEMGGFHVTSRDPVKHEVHAIAKGEPGAVCAAMHVASPCLPLRLHQLGLARRPVGITADEMARSLQGGITIEGLPPPVVAPSTAPYVWGAAGILAVGIAGVLASRWWKKRATSPAAQLVTLARRVQDKLASADAVLAAPLAPAVAAALRSLKERKVDATSAEGKRVAAVLMRVEARLDESVVAARAEEEQKAADELVHEMESALEAADEARGYVKR